MTWNRLCFSSHFSSSSSSSLSLLFQWVTDDPIVITWECRLVKHLSRSEIIFRSSIDEDMNSSARGNLIARCHHHQHLYSLCHFVNFHHLIIQCKFLFSLSLSLLRFDIFISRLVFYTTSNFDSRARARDHFSRTVSAAAHSWLFVCVKTCYFISTHLLLDLLLLYLYVQSAHSV